MNKDIHHINQLLEIMSKLRDPVKGCPWDLEQTFETIVPHTLEEAYEVADAIENKQPADIKAELGDLLLQIVFYCQLANEKGWFDFSDVVKGLTDKLIQRHPHVFSDEKIQSAKEQHNHWESYKEKERQRRLQKENSVLADVPKNFPALSRAQKLQNRAARVGFDWLNVHSVLDKVQEEIKEFEEAFEEKNMPHAEEELGDILFVCANLARHLQSDAETILRRANAKFERRFRGIEVIVNHSGKKWQDFTLGELEALWQQVKRDEENDKITS